MKIDRKIIKEAIDKEVLNENPLAGPIAGVKGVVGGIKGAFQNMGANYRLSNVGSQMDQFAKKSKKAWDLNSGNAKKQIDKMMLSKNQDVAAAAQTVGQQLQQADQQIGQTLDFVSNNVARTMIAAGGGSAKDMNAQNNVSMGTAGMEKSLSSKGIYPKMIGKKEYLQVVELMQKINKTGGLQNLANFEREMVKKGIRPDRLGKREYGVEVMSYLENEYMKLLSAQNSGQGQSAPNDQANSAPQVPPTPIQNSNQLRPRPPVAAPPSANNVAPKVGAPQMPINLSNKPAPSTPEQAPPQANRAPSAQHQGVQPTKRGYGVDKRFTSNAEPSNLKPQDFGPATKKGFEPQAQSEPQDDNAEDFQQIIGNIQNSEPFKQRSKSWKGASASSGFPKISKFEADLEAAPSPQEEQSYSSENEPSRQGVISGDIQNAKSRNQDGNYFNAGRSQMPRSSKLSRDQLGQKDPRYMPYVGSGEAPAEPIPLTRSKSKTPPPVPPEAKKRKFPKIQSQEKTQNSEKALPKERPESNATLYYKMLQKASEEGKPLKPDELKDLQAWQTSTKNKPKAAPETAETSRGWWEPADAPWTKAAPKKAAPKKAAPKKAAPKKAAPKKAAPKKAAPKKAAPKRTPTKRSTKKPAKSKAE